VPMAYPKVQSNGLQQCFEFGLGKVVDVDSN
jgi:hypothetical protein